MNRIRHLIYVVLWLSVVPINAATLNISPSPLFVTDTVAPLTMIVMGRDHKLYFEAYNDATDLTGNGEINTTFSPDIAYYGYFDSGKCYGYTLLGRYFYPVSLTSTGKCSGLWSGNFLNYLTTARLDAIRKVLYGGDRSTDTATDTILERTYIPQDGHSWGKEYQSVAVNGYSISDYTPFSAPSSNRYNLFANVTLRADLTAAPLLRVALNQPYRIWEWVSTEAPVAGSTASTDGILRLPLTNLTDYVVRVKVCDSNVGLEDNCQAYTNGNYKPTGLLQQFGENNSMYFGLLTGSYTNNLAGGVIRSNISSITDEINLKTGQFTTVNGIISTLNKLTLTGFDINFNYTTDCGFITTRNITNGECEMWGSPLGEMLYEAMRYFAGKGSPTSAFNYSSGTDTLLGLPKPTWDNPYKNYPYCSKANIVLIGDIYPSYDSDSLPGSYFNSFSGDLSGLNVSSIANTIFGQEGYSNILAFIGQSGSIADGAPTPKAVTSFSNIRGLAPQEANSEGTFYVASVANYGWLNDLNSVQGKQNVKTFVIALSSPKADIQFKVGKNTIKILPFGKSVAGFGISKDQGKYQPTNDIIDFYIESLTATGGVFRVNFSDLQQGGDYDMDAIVKYTVKVNSNQTLSVTTETIYAAGSITQHLGYVISGTTADGVYLEVRDSDTSANADVDYFLDTPPGQKPGGKWQDNVALPIATTRVFSPSTTPSAVNFESPLFYAAKWGGFNDSNGNNIPDIATEYDTTGNGLPDNYFLVTDPGSLYSQLSSAFKSILDRSGSFASVSLNGGSLTSNTILYQPIFRTKDWTGQLLAFAIDTLTGDISYDGAASQGAKWDAGSTITSQNFNTGRQILTYKPTQKTGIPFRWPLIATKPGIKELDLNQIKALNLNPTTNTLDNLGNLRLNYLRGDKSKEVQNKGTFRNRTTLLGDIIGSMPTLVGPPNQRYPMNWGTSAAENTVPYSDYITNNSNRRAMLYFGSNDGMMHALDATNGNEVMAYIPSGIYNNLNQLTNPNYTHQFYVDGAVTPNDVFYNGSWHSTLVGSLNAGGQGIYALDITDPTIFTETNANSVVEWEFTDANDADLGYTFSQPSIVRLANGQWAAIFGNGYNNTFADGLVSTTGNAVIYVVNIQTGALIKKFDTGVGMSADPLSSARPNGMSTPLVVDIDSNGIADFIYAGDLFGNLWKIDISGTSVSQWDFSYKLGTTPQPFFVATNSSGVRQPITTRPAVSRINYTAQGLQIYVGTGKYFETNDKTDLTVQTMYALQDTNTRITSRAQLQQQSIVQEDASIRVTSSTKLSTGVKGWYLDLLVSTPMGERMIANPVYANGKIIFTTTIPTTDPCTFGGTSWLMELNALDGRRLDYNVFDLNNDGTIDSSDSVAYLGSGGSTSVTASGIKSTVGLMATPAILSAGTKEYKYSAGTGGGIQKINENPGPQIYGRQSWRQFQ